MNADQRTEANTYIASDDTKQWIRWEHKQFLPQATYRGTIIGLTIGTLILISNFQFGLQTGWVSMMSLPAALLACSIFKNIWPIFFPNATKFTDVEVVYVQSMAVAVGTGPLAYGFIGVLPAIEKLLTKEESGGFKKACESFSFIQLLLWSSALAFFGIFFAVPLRKQVIVKEKLKFPSGSATATLISVLTGSEVIQEMSTPDLMKIRNDRISVASASSKDDFNKLDHHVLPNNFAKNDGSIFHRPSSSDTDSTPLLHNSLETNNNMSINNNAINKTCKNADAIYSKNILILIKTLTLSASFTIFSYFFPILQNVPFLGSTLASSYLWTFQISPAYIGQGAIMGLPTSACMLFGCILGWGILGPIAKNMNWLENNENCINGDGDLVHRWIIWTSLAIMIADSFVGFVVYGTRSIVSFYCHKNKEQLIYTACTDSLQSILLEETDILNRHNKTINTGNCIRFISDSEDREVERSNLIQYTTVISGLIVSSILCVVLIVYIFGRDIIPIYAIITSLILAFFFSILAIRALGETDLNPVSGIGKLSQLIFALIIPKSNPSSVLINLVAGGVAEAGAQQAGDLMQDLKTGHLLGASPKAQFTAQIVGATWSIFVSSLIYICYNKVYSIPNNQFRIPTAYVWADSARLLNGKGLPDKALESSIMFGSIFAFLSLIRNCYKEKGYWWLKYIPSGTAVGIGIYNTPNFTLARFVGGLGAYLYSKRCKGTICNTILIIFCSGLILGEGCFSVVNMLLVQFKIPHF